jgi:regulator of cell morphogenesis and NO signaling
LAEDTDSLVAHVLERFHETHRRDLPPILAITAELRRRGVGEVLASQVEALAAHLESHMFREEMRLFPMMAQGGNALIKLLVDDMSTEHVQQRRAISRISLQLADLAVAGGAAPEVAQLQAALGKLFDDLHQHMQFEDELLFPRFLAAAAR